MYVIKLADGTEIKDLELNGNNYVSKTKIDEDIFKNNLSQVIISDDETETVYHNMEFVQQVEESDGWYIVFRELTEQELLEKRLDAKIEYIAMMTDVDLMEV